MSRAVKIGVGISGGVDSAVTALLLKEQGFAVVGYTMSLGRTGEERSIAEARSVAEWLGIPFKVCDLAEAWRREVTDYIRSTYLAGETPNPCVRCNERVKFGLLPETAFADGCDFFATGHYARTGVDASGRAWLKRGVDRKKDQSYFLYRVRQEVLARTMFPLGGMTKEEVRDKARAAGFPVAEKGDSQDFCGGDPMDFVGEPDRDGEIVDVGGHVLGHHRGFWHFTPGKRKGLGIGGGTPYYVIGLDPERNRVVVAFKENAIVTDFCLKDCVWRVDENEVCETGEQAELFVKVRSGGEPRGPVRCLDQVCIYEAGLHGVAPGQSAVLYRGDEVLGGGVIDYVLV